jgi:phenazine biosynthesis protein PhzF family
MNIYKVFAFTGDRAGGNAACIVELDNWLPDGEMLRIAQENGVAETAFFVKAGNGSDGRYLLRWFTPDVEMDLCGHATLACAYTISQVLKYPGNPVRFDTASGPVSVAVGGDGLLTLDFPSRAPVPAQLPSNIFDSLSIKPREVLKARDYVLLYDSPQQILDIALDRDLFDKYNIDPGGVVITAAAGEDTDFGCDFVSRFFTPQATILEDPVTGSAHCSLVPFWSVRLGKKALKARQLSESGGVLYCRDEGPRVSISGYAKLAEE